MEITSQDLGFPFQLEHGCNAEISGVENYDCQAVQTGWQSLIVSR